MATEDESSELLTESDSVTNFESSFDSQKCKGGPETATEVERSSDAQLRKREEVEEIAEEVEELAVAQTRDKVEEEEFADAQPEDVPTKDAGSLTLLGR